MKVAFDRLIDQACGARLPFFPPFSCLPCRYLQRQHHLSISTAQRQLEEVISKVSNTDLLGGLFEKTLSFTLITAFSEKDLFAMVRAGRLG